MPCSPASYYYSTMYFVCAPNHSHGSCLTIIAKLMSSNLLISTESSSTNFKDPLEVV